MRHLTAQAEARQKEAGGTMYLSTMLQHLVGATLQVLLPDNHETDPSLRINAWTPPTKRRRRSPSTPHHPIRIAGFSRAC